MIRRFDPHGYPGPRPAGPVLVHPTGVHPVVVEGTHLAPVRLAGTTALRADDVAVLADPTATRWSVAYGSNASPSRLRGKSLDRDGALLLPARAVGVAPAYEARRTTYGSVPLTLVPAEGIVEVWVLGLPARDLDLLDRTEGRVPDTGDTRTGTEAPVDDPEDPADGHVAAPGTYRLASIGGVVVADRFLLSSALAYLPGPATRIQVTEDGGWRTWPASDQRQAAAHLDAAGPARPAPPAGEVVTGAWPETPLADAPVFVPHPGDRALPRLGAVDGRAPWRPIPDDLLTDLATVVGPAEAPRPAGGSTGSLLAPRDAAAAAELLARLEQYGRTTGAVRTSVRVRGPRGPGWALAYLPPSGPDPPSRSPS